MLVFETLNLQFRALVDPEHNGRALYSLRVHVTPSYTSSTGFSGSEKTVSMHDKIATSNSSIGASFSVRDESQLPDPDGGARGWKYWDGHVGQRPPKCVDAAVAVPARPGFSVRLFRDHVKDLVSRPLR